MAQQKVYARVPTPAWMDHIGLTTTSWLCIARWRVSSPAPMKWNTAASGAMSKYMYISVRRSCVCAGIVFQLLPGSRRVKPITSWQLSHLPGRMNWWIVRTLQSSTVPRWRWFASSNLMSFVGYSLCAGYEAR